jgi:hypothetical protein
MNLLKLFGVAAGIAGLILFADQARADQLRVHFRFDDSKFIGSGPLVDGAQPFTELVLYTDLEHANDALFPVYGSLDHTAAGNRYPAPIFGVCKMGIPYPIFCGLTYRNKELRLLIYPPNKHSELAAPEWFTGFEIRYLIQVSAEVVQDSAMVQSE